MPLRSERLPLLTASPGSARHLTIYRFGTPGARPKVYLQAALHADETPGSTVTTKARSVRSPGSGRRSSRRS